MDVSDASSYDRAKEVKAFDDTKVGVKGLVDAGVVNVPRMFIRPPGELAEELTTHRNRTDFQVPVVDLGGLSCNKLEDIVDHVLAASETWGFFQVVNHGIPLKLLEDVIEGVHKFNEQDVEVKKQYYTRDPTKNVRFNTNFDLHYSRTASWRDTLLVFPNLSSGSLDPAEVPHACRDALIEYMKEVSKLGETLFEIISMGLGLKPGYLKGIGCCNTSIIASHYYPHCPHPELTLGSRRHSDPSFLTILLQDQIGGLQVFYENQWTDVNPIPGALVVNIGDFLQVVSNNKLKSVDHRVTSNIHKTPRVSVACFLSGNATETQKSYGPIEELVSEENPPVYKEFLASEYMKNYLLKQSEAKSHNLESFKF